MRPSVALALAPCTPVTGSATAPSAAGRNILGQLVNGNNAASLVPVGVTQRTGADQVASGHYITCTAARCWGHNDWVQLGNGTPVNASSPLADLDVLTRSSSGTAPTHRHLTVSLVAPSTSAAQEMTRRTALVGETLDCCNP